MGELFKPRGLFEVTGRHCHSGWKDKGVRPLPRANELSLPRQRRELKKKKKTDTPVYSLVEGTSKLTLLPVAMRSGNLEMLTLEAESNGVGMDGDVV